MFKIQSEFLKLAKRVQDMNDAELRAYYEKHELHGYHSTSSKNLDKIKQEGLVPQQIGAAKRIYLSNDPKDAEYESELSHPDEKKSMLRIKHEHTKATDRNKKQREFHIDSTISPENIEHWDEDSVSWKPLVEKKKIQKDN